VDTFDPEKFYLDLIKTPMTLRMRNFLGELLAASVCRNNHDIWQKLNADSDKFSNPLTKLRTLGYLPLNLSNATDIISQLRAVPHEGKGRPGPGFRTETEPLKDVHLLPSIKRLINDKSLFNLVSLYLGAPATLHSCQAWWQYPMGPSHNPSNAQLWHRDRDDIAELKLFFYATDVCNESGPHSFIPGSHSCDGLDRIFPSDSLQDPVINGQKNQFVDDSYFINFNLKSKPKVWLGSAGTCFLEDTRGFHKACVPTNKPRLLMSLIWTVGSGYRSN